MELLKSVKSILSFAVLLIGLGCAGTNQLDDKLEIRSNVVEPKEDHNAPSDWPALFRNIPGLKIAGSYPNLSIMIRGSKSISQSSEPLYVLDGVPLGRVFSSLAGATDPLQVKKVRVLKGAEASKYGMRGTNGVIEVTTKN